MINSWQVIDTQKSIKKDTLYTRYRLLQDETYVYAFNYISMEKNTYMRSKLCIPSSPQLHFGTISSLKTLDTID